MTTQQLLTDAAERARQMIAACRFADPPDVLIDGRVLWIDDVALGIRGPRWIADGVEFPNRHEAILHAIKTNLVYRISQADVERATADGGGD